MEKKVTNQPLKILLAGGSGAIGSLLAPYLRTQGHKVELLHRHDPEATLYWNPEQQILRASLEGYDVIINLAGYPVASGRWSKSRKKKILDSRLLSTRLLVDRMNSCQHKPKLFISASGVGYYGDSKDEAIDEAYPSGSGFLAEVCKRWEEEAKRYAMRTVILRIGMALTRTGGAFSSMLPVFRLGLGGPLGTGEQKMSWIGIDDILGVIKFAIQTPTLSGPINVVAGSVTNNEFSKTLASLLHRPCFMRLPAAMLRLLLGQMGEELLLSSISASPQKLLNAGYTFRSQNLTDTLTQLLSLKDIKFHKKG